MKTPCVIWACALGLLLEFNPFCRGEIAIGSTKTEVIQELGKPEAEIMNLGMEILSYGGAEIELKFGRVIRMDADVAERARSRQAEQKQVPQQVAQAPVAAGSPNPVPAAIPVPSAAGQPHVQVIRNNGANINLSELTVPGKITLVDFFADWCGPCRAISPMLEKIANEDPDVYLRKVDIVKWGTPVAQQYGLQSIPNIRVFNRQGQPVGKPTHVYSVVVDNIKQAR